MRLSWAVRMRSSTSSRMTAGDFGEVGGLQHVDQLVHLLDDLRALEGIDVHHDGHAGELGSSVRATVRLSML